MIIRLGINVRLKVICDKSLLLGSSSLILIHFLDSSPGSDVAGWKMVSGQVKKFKILFEELEINLLNKIPMHLFGFY